MYFCNWPATGYALLIFQEFKDYSINVSAIAQKHNYHWLCLSLSEAATAIRYMHAVKIDVQI
jgi:hypothetical protein